LATENLKRDDRNRGDDRGLRYAEKNSEAKKRATAGAIAGGLGSRDECDDCVVEAENANLAYEISRRPRH
jgi:hypothetical protein